jgi:hypothetical protein
MVFFVLDSCFLIIRHVHYLIRCNKSHSSISFAAYYLPQNAGDISRKFIKDQKLLSFIDAEV